MCMSVWMHASMCIYTYIYIFRFICDLHVCLTLKFMAFPSLLSLPAPSPDSQDSPCGFLLPSDHWFGPQAVEFFHIYAATQPFHRWSVPEEYHRSTKCLHHLECMKPYAWGDKLPASQPATTLLVLQDLFHEKKWSRSPSWMILAFLTAQNSSLNPSL